MAVFEQNKFLELQLEYDSLKNEVSYPYIFHINVLYNIYLLYTTITYIIKWIYNYSIFLYKFYFKTYIIYNL